MFSIYISRNKGKSYALYTQVRSQEKALSTALDLVCRDYLCYVMDERGQIIASKTKYLRTTGGLQEVENGKE